MEADFTGQVAVITCGAGAIGTAMVKKFAHHGAKVVDADINEKGVNTVAASIADVGGEALPVVVNVGSKTSAEAMIDLVLNKYGRIDILVNNAGIIGGPSERKPIHEYSDELWDKIISVDLNSVFYCSKPAIKGMICQGKGSIINIASIVGLVPLLLQFAFAAAKAGVVNLSKAMAIELAEYGIRVNCIAPGSIICEGTRKLFYSNAATAEALLSHVPLGEPGEPEDIANMTCYLASDMAQYMTGSVATVDGGWTCGFAKIMQHE